jgi:hypothetical protein
MTQPAYLKNLKAYARRDRREQTPKEAVAAVAGESDRGAIILAATGVEDDLQAAILSRLPGLADDDAAMETMFGLNGALGAFSKKIQMAYAMGIVDDPARRLLDLIRETRNACAHARLPLSFKEAVLRDIVKQVVAEALPRLVDQDHPLGLRHLFVMKCVLLSDYIQTGQNRGLVEALDATFDELAKVPL